jgi:hypothetical protein
MKGHYAVIVTLSFLLILTSLNGVTSSSRQYESQNLEVINELVKTLQPENLLPVLIESLGRDTISNLDCYKSLLPFLPSSEIPKQKRKTPEWVYRSK